MLTVIKTGGKQYTVKLGDIAKVEKLTGKVGDTLYLESFFLTQDGVFLKNNSVTAEIIAQTKSKKILVFKKKRRKNYRKIQGHRQNQTILKIVAINHESKSVSDNHVTDNKNQTTCLTHLLDKNAGITEISEVDSHGT